MAGLRTDDSDKGVQKEGPFVVAEVRSQDGVPSGDQIPAGEERSASMEQILLLLEQLESDGSIPADSIQTPDEDWLEEMKALDEAEFALS
jgi:hypothetical protein